MPQLTWAFAPEMSESLGSVSSMKTSQSKTIQTLHHKCALFLDKKIDKLM